MTDVPQLVEEFAKEVAKQLPIKEALTPAVLPAGQLMSDLVKTIQLALAPLQFAGAYQDRLRHFIDASVRRVPITNRVSPAPQILGRQLSKEYATNLKAHLLTKCFRSC
jgi:hypothetical protein